MIIVTRKLLVEDIEVLIKTIQHTGALLSRRFFPVTEELPPLLVEHDVEEGLSRSFVKGSKIHAS